MLRLKNFNHLLLNKQILRTQCRSFSDKPPIQVVKDADSGGQEFRVLNLDPKQEQTQMQKRKPFKRSVKHRYRNMREDQDWGNVWPGPKTFHPSAVPLPVRQGYRDPRETVPSPNKYANAELMKIPNFLHLTPPVVKRQCEALKKFCTPWPAGLETDEECDKHFPIEYLTSDYCHGLPTIRNPLARIVTLRLKLSTLPLDKHARDKFLRLVGERYDEKTDYLTIVTDRCPLRKQNTEYARYLLAALFHESHTVEPWEALKTEADMEYYEWNRNKSKESIETILTYGVNKDEPKPSTDAFAASVEQLFNEQESEQNLQNYKEEVLKVLGLHK